MVRRRICGSSGSPDGAQRNPGTKVRLVVDFGDSSALRADPDFASLHPGYDFA
jgi:hypothetical protein